MTASTTQLPQPLTKEPGWLGALRASALKQFEALPWPHPSDDIWRRTDVSLLDPSCGFAISDGPGALQSLPLTDAQLAQFTQPLADEWLAVRADGETISQTVPSGITVGDLSAEHGDWVQSLMATDGLSEPERKFTSLNLAHHRRALIVDIPDGFQGDVPLRLVNLISAKPGVASFPLTLIRVGRGASVRLIHEDVGTSAAASVEPHLIHGRIELLVEDGANAHFFRIQRWAASAREFFLQRATVRESAQLNLVSINLGAAVSKTHVIANLVGRHASSHVLGFVFGQGSQHIDFHSLQHHQAPQTMSDLLYKAALKDRSRMIYTGLIRITKAAQQTDAYQANHNLMLSPDAKAETIPMLEILADDVRCKHGATVGPVDEEQLFYLCSRGIERSLAERLLVMGFVQPVLDAIGYEPLQQRLHEELEGSLL